MRTTLFFRSFAAITAVVLASGCAMQAPRYTVSIDNVEQIKRAASQVKVGSFTVQAGTGGAIGLRGSPMSSSVGNDYAAYLADALQQELKLAGKLNADSKLEISGQLLKNDISAGGFSTNSGEMEARFVVTNAGTVRFEKTKRAELSWESSFLGGVAIPKAQQQYPAIVQKLLSLLWGDAEFQAALK
jgi:hypothetical protein